MGVVYEGFDPMLERRVAVKTILQSLSHASEPKGPAVRPRISRGARRKRDVP